MTYLEDLAAKRMRTSKYCMQCFGMPWRRPLKSPCKCGEHYSPREEVTVASMLDSGELSLASHSMMPIVGAADSPLQGRVINDERI